MLRWEELILEYAKLIISWPIVTLVICILVGKYYKQSVEGLLSRIICGSFPGGKVEFAPQSQEALKANIDVVTTEGSVQPQTREEWIEWIKKFPEKAYEHGENLANAVMFEKIYNIIFGSQIELLEYLEKKGTHGDTHLVLSFFYIEYTKRIPSSNYPQQDYYNFLYLMGLTILNGDKMILTEKGQLFLKYIRNNYPNYSNKQY